MKKLIPFLLISSLLLSACNILDSSNFELQEKCAKHSEKLFAEKGYNFEKGTLSNYYNKKLDICFALFESSDFSN